MDAKKLLAGRTSKVLLQIYFLPITSVLPTKEEYSEVVQILAFIIYLIMMTELTSSQADPSCHPDVSFCIAVL